MFIRSVTIELAAAIKIYDKHFVLSEEIERVLRSRKTIFKRVGGNQYVALGVADRYLTIFFGYDSKSKEAIVTTAYPSSRKQIKSYRRIR